MKRFPESGSELYIKIDEHIRDFETQFKQNVRSKFFYSQIRLVCSSALYLQKIVSMTAARKSRGIYWILFFVSIAVFFGVYAVAGGYCSMILPFNVTFLALAMDLM